VANHICQHPVDRHGPGGFLHRWLLDHPVRRGHNPRNLVPPRNCPGPGPYVEHAHLPAVGDRVHRGCAGRAADHDPDLLLDHGAALPSQGDAPKRSHRLRHRLRPVLIGLPGRERTGWPAVDNPWTARGSRGGRHDHGPEDDLHRPAPGATSFHPTVGGALHRGVQGDLAAGHHRGVRHSLHRPDRDSRPDRVHGQHQGERPLRVRDLLDLRLPDVQGQPAPRAILLTLEALRRSGSAFSSLFIL